MDYVRLKNTHTLTNDDSGDGEDYKRISPEARSDVLGSEVLHGIACSDRSLCHSLSDLLNPATMMLRLSVTMSHSSFSDTSDTH